MDGFFTLAEDKNPKSQWDCKKCKLYENSSDPQFDPIGNFGKEIMIVGSGFAEDQYVKNRKVLSPKEYFKTDVGRYLDWAFKKNGIDIMKDCVYLNAINCVTEKKISITHVKCCLQEKVMPAIRKYRPKAVFLLGEHSVQSVIGGRWGNALYGMGRWRGTKIPDQELGCWLFPIDDACDIRDNSKAYQLLWRNDIESALALNLVPFPDNSLDNINVFYHYKDDVGKKIEEFVKPHKMTSLDYETSGIRPYRQEHTIYCAAVAVSPTRVISVMFPEDVNSNYLDGFVNYLRNKNIKKISHNMNFEETWSREILGTQVMGWHLDTMLAAHVIDSRPQFCGLKFQVYANFGIMNYDKGVQDYIGADTIDETNRFDELVKTKKGQELLLKYCAYDAALTFRLAKIQSPLLGVEL